jgi:hypothetical protein
MASRNSSIPLWATLVRAQGVAPVLTPLRIGRIAQPLLRMPEGKGWRCLAAGPQVRKFCHGHGRSLVGDGLQ